MPWFVDHLITSYRSPHRGAAAVLLGAWWLWWRLPKRKADRVSLKIRDEKAHARCRGERSPRCRILEDNLRVAGEHVTIFGGS